MKCNVPECQNDAYCRGYCKKHYSRLIRTGELELRKPKTCSVEGCNERVLAKGFCRQHYDMVRRYGEVKEVNRVTYCKVCGEKARSKGFCKKHYNEFYRGKRDIDGNLLENVSNISSETLDK